MKRFIFFLAGFALISCPLGLNARPACAQEDYSRHLYPLAKPLPSPEIIIDVSDAPDARAWAEKAQVLTRDWFPQVCRLLATDHYTPPKFLKLIFKKTLDVPAYAAGDEISVNASWIRKHPEDFGMVIHEMTHVIQHYPSRPGSPGWLVEGIADYIRWWRYEPETPRTRIDTEKASYRDSYRTTAAFLAWIVAKYDRRIVRRLDERLREGTYNNEIFLQTTGKSLDDLWSEFLAVQKSRTRP